MTTKTSKVALVTGGSRGLGKDMAIQLSNKGFDVILTYNSQDQLANEVVTQIKSTGKQAAALHLDVADIKSYDLFATNLKSALEKLGYKNLNALVNNAGVGVHVSIADTSEEIFDNMVDIHLKAPYFLTQKLLPILADGGSIVNISSGLARFSFPNYAPYAIMKAAVESLSRYQAQEFGNRKIRVNTVAPGAIETDFGGGALRNSPDLQKIIAGNTALGRVGQADDLGGVVAFLCSEDAKWVNAQRIEVAGGFNI